MGELEEIIEKLPDIVARKDIGKYLGGMISPKTMANLDSLGKGPKATIRLGRTVGYTKAELAKFLRSKIKIHRMPI